MITSQFKHKIPCKVVAHIVLFGSNLETMNFSIDLRYQIQLQA